MSKFSFHLDHVVVVVSNLTKAMDQFHNLGFTVREGGQNGPTHNALIVFRDGTYIELISTHSRLSGRVFRFCNRAKLYYLLKPFISSLTLRFIGWLGGPSGIRDWCIRTDHLEQVVSSLRSNNIPMSNIKLFRRIKPNLETAEWLLAAPKDQRFPFLIKDNTPVEIRVPGGDSTLHDNGCAGIQKLLISGNRSNVSIERFAAQFIPISSDVNERSQKAIEYVDDSSSQITVVLAMGEGRTCILHVHKEFPQLTAQSEMKSA